MIQYLIACLILILGVNTTQMLLQDARHLIKGMPYTTEQKMQLAKAAKKVLQAF